MIMERAVLIMERLSTEKPAEQRAHPQDHRVRVDHRGKACGVLQRLVRRLRYCRTSAASAVIANWRDA
jgi:hypothetical protein